MKKLFLLLTIALSLLFTLATPAQAIPGIWKSAQPSLSPISGLDHTIVGRICSSRPIAGCIAPSQLQGLANTHSHPSPTFMTVGTACPVMGQYVYSWTYSYDATVGKYKQRYWAQVCGF
jgi:hypothetical protein